MIKTCVNLPVGYTLDDVKAAVSAHLPIEKRELTDITLLRSELSLADKSRPEYKLTVGISLSEEREAGLLKMRKKVAAVPSYEMKYPSVTLPARPVVIGAGPCGLFAALYLAECGARPILIERGERVEERRERIRRFELMGELSEESNVQFGEGGAGTYSDGKLKVGGMDEYKMKVLCEFCKAGAPDEIMHSKTAHLGTDKLSEIVKNIRNKIIKEGGEVIFSAKFVDYKLKDGSLVGIIYEKEGERVELATSDAILAIGHSARDTYSMLYKKGVPMEAKGFGIGMRIEHPREYINELIYGKNYDSRLETASYHLVTHLPSGRSVYSFCMCPGGSVVAAASEHFGIVTNGMSEYNRDGRNSNAALLVSVTADDFPDSSPLGGVELQRRIERSAFSLTEEYKAPCIRAGELLGCGVTDGNTVSPSYPRGTQSHSPEKYLPNYIVDSLKMGISDFDKWLPGYYLSSSVLTGPETRTTAPVRLLRTEKREILGISGIYPAGEGAGYAGGIVSSAVDGLRCAEALLSKYENK